MKLKDDVDFKKLENYGLERQYLVDSWGWILDYQKGFYKEHITIWEEDRELQINAIGLLSVVYDMIQDGIIEKVVEEDL